MTEFHFETRAVASVPDSWSPSEVLSHFLTSRHAHSDDPFFSINLGLLPELVQTWRRLFPSIRPFYAVKCNPDPLILSVLARMGVGFDCASKGEIQTVLGVSTHSGKVPPSKIIYANPCKQLSHIKFARQQGVSLVTFDNSSELHKYASLHPTCKLVLRIAVDDSTSLCKLSNKFGCELTAVAELLQLARELSLCVVGVSFHVGSGCMDGDVFRTAIMDSRSVFNTALEYGYRFTLLDIGGGFPACGSQASPSLTFLESLSDVINTSLSSHFSDWAGLEVIAEPGRYFAGCSHTLAVSVTAYRHVSSADAVMYYVNEGVYGSFNCILFDHQTPEAEVLCSRKSAKPVLKSSVWGPSCDGLDQILREVQLPLLSVGDWLYFQQMGAYTRASRSDFNGFAAPTNYYYAPSAQFYNLLSLLAPCSPPEILGVQGGDRKTSFLPPHRLQAQSLGLVVSAIS